MWFWDNDALIFLAPHCQESQSQCFIINVRIYPYENSHLHEAVFWAWATQSEFKPQLYHW